MEEEPRLDGAVFGCEGIGFVAAWKGDGLDGGAAWTVFEEDIGERQVRKRFRVRMVLNDAV
ncbi:hypothetical protein FNV43_RR18993 [Rhamnella rubrinervis]|uniref:Uncharacterized protein n=1 Tax=Rhamnella rubrinervis TaxID=2594499 RepID=A0A8K0EBR1_9ROSA|nr:hypothetical protein FNV43_RR18993 [Rhamnella rubrinervis]